MDLAAVPLIAGDCPKSWEVPWPVKERWLPPCRWSHHPLIGSLRLIFTARSTLGGGVMSFSAWGMEPNRRPPEALVKALKEREGEHRRVS
jgi:hypothetical protein